MFEKGKVSYSSPSNIAIIKYWGKNAGDQIPMNPSLSMTLDKCRSFTSVEYEVGKGINPVVEVYFDGKRAIEVEAKLQRWFTKISYFFSWLSQARLLVQTRNNFPHSAGIASSASGMSALSVCLAAIDERIRKTVASELSLKSNIARLGSGSAARSVMGPWVIWGKTPHYQGASDDHAIVLENIHPMFEKLQDTIIVVDNQPKAISSRAGHGLMNDHPWRQGRIDQVNANLSKLLRALKEGDWNLFSSVTENEALSLHALMLASTGGMMLWKGSTVSWMHYLREQREEKNLRMTFTLDAGANIHLLYPDDEKEKLREILAHSPLDVIDLIYDQTGYGPKKYEENV